MLIGARPNRPIEKGITGQGLTADAAISKFVGHQPLYRQGQILKWQGGKRDPAARVGAKKLSLHRVERRRPPCGDN